MRCRSTYTRETASEKNNVIAEPENNIIRARPESYENIPKASMSI